MYREATVESVVDTGVAIARVYRVGFKIDEGRTREPAFLILTQHRILYRYKP